MNITKPNNTKKPKVAILHYSGPPNISGVDVIIRDQARMFRLNNYRVEIIAGSGKPFRKDIPVRINKLISPKNPIIYKIRQELEKGVVSDLYKATEEKLYNYLKKHIIKNDIGVIIIHNLFTRHYNLAYTAAIVRISQDLPNVKFLVWVHDITFYNEADFHLSKNLAALYPWKLLVTPHENFTYICVSEFLKSDLLSTFNTPPKKNRIHVIPVTHDIQKFFGLSPTMRQLYSRIDFENTDLVASIPVRAIPRKRLEFAIDVAKVIIDKGINFKLLLTANMDKKREENIAYYHFLKKKVSEANLSNNVFFLEDFFQQFSQPGKPKQYVQVQELFLISDFLIFPSVLEGFGMPLIEAGFMRCPIFASNIPPFKEIGNSTINYFTLEDTPEYVADLILKKLKTYSQSSFYRKVIRKYSMHRVFKEDIIPLVVG